MCFPPSCTRTFAPEGDHAEARGAHASSELMSAVGGTSCLQGTACAGARNCFPCSAQSRKKHPGKNGDDGDYYQEFDQGKVFLLHNFPPLSLFFDFTSFYNFFSVLCGMYPAFSDLETRGFFQKNCYLSESVCLFAQALHRSITLFYISSGYVFCLILH